MYMFECMCGCYSYTTATRTGTIHGPICSNLLANFAALQIDREDLDAASHLLAQSESILTQYGVLKRSFPRGPEWLIVTGVLASRQGDFAGAAAIFEEAVTIITDAEAMETSHGANLWMELGVVQCALHEHDAAQVAFDRAVAIRENAATLLTRLGHTLLEHIKITLT